MIGCLLFGVMFVVSAAFTLQSYESKRQAEKSFQSLRDQVSAETGTQDQAGQNFSPVPDQTPQEVYGALKEQNTDFVGWISIDGTAIDYPVMVCPLAKMYTLGSNFIPSANHAGGLRYHGMSSILSQLYHDGYLEAQAVEQHNVFEAAEQFARVEGILPAPESSHAIRVAIDEALKCKETGEAKTIVFGLTGTGYFDMAASSE